MLRGSDELISNSSAMSLSPGAQGQAFPGFPWERIPLEERQAPLTVGLGPHR